VVLDYKETDSLWYTYTNANVTGCGRKSLVPGILMHPVMSPSTAELWADTGAVVVRDSLDTIVLQDTYQDNLYLWAIDKTRWTIVGLYISGPQWAYQASFYYGDFQGIPYLQKVVDYLGTVYYDFNNIRLNGQAVSPVRMPVSYRSGPSGLSVVSASGGLARIALPDAGGSDQRLTLLDAAGRAIGTWTLPSDARQFALPLAGPGRFCLVRWQAGEDRRSATLAGGR
jgi:hypothetical protein